MKKRVFIIHGWEGRPDQHWLPWLGQQLEEKGFEVNIPQMPETEHPKIGQWVPYLEKLVIKPDPNTYFIGHSIGCQTIIRYLEKINPQKIGGALFVAGFFNLPNLQTEEEKKIAEPWLETPIDMEKVKGTTKNFVLILSDNDQDVPMEESRTHFSQRLNPKIIIEHNMGHFTADDGVTELPVVLEELLKMAG